MKKWLSVLTTLGLVAILLLGSIQVFAQGTVGDLPTGNKTITREAAFADADPFIISDYYSGYVNDNGTLRLVNKTTGATIVDNAPGFYLNYGDIISIDLPAFNPSFEIDSNSDGIPDGWDVNKTYIRQSTDYASDGVRSLKFAMTSSDTGHRNVYSSLMTCVPEKKYSISIDSYYSELTGDFGSAYVSIAWYMTPDGSGDEFESDTIIRVPINTGEWNTNQFLWAPPVGAESFRVNLYVDR